MLNDSFELNQKLTLTETTFKVSPLFFNMGVVEIEVTNELNSVTYEFKTLKEFINLSNYSITLKEGLISINSNLDLQLTILNNQPYLLTSTYSGFIESEDVFENKELNILLFFMKEMTTVEEIKIDSKQSLKYEENRVACSFWDTYYVYSTGGNLSVAEAGLADEIAHYSSGFSSINIAGCSTIGGVNTSCLWGQHACVASQAFCCN